MQCESYKLFSLWQNEDYSPGHSISDSTEKLLQRYKVGGGVSINVILVNAECKQSSTYFLQNVSASHKE